MTGFVCPTCGGTHDLERIEPTFTRPDAFVAIPVDARAARASHNDDFCVIVSEDKTTLSFFVRTVLPVVILGESRSIRWGVWVEVDQTAYQTLADHGEDPSQAGLGPFPATLANRIPNYPETLGLPGWMRPTGPTTRPEFQLSPDSTHLFVRETTEGVLPERAFEWRMWGIHPPASPT